jgi:hypothetical protein
MCNALLPTSPNEFRVVFEVGGGNVGGGAEELSTDLADFAAEA